MTVDQDNGTSKFEIIENEPVKVRKALPLWVVLLAFALLVGFLSLIGWGLNRSQAGPVQLGDKVPGLKLTGFDGKTYNTADMAGKVVLLNFWASWCDPCAQEAPALEDAWKALKDRGDVVFLGIDYVDTEPQALAFLDKFKVSYPNGPDLRTAISQYFRIRGVPETYIIGKDGRLKYAKIGPFTSVEEIQQAIDGAMKE